MILSSYPILSLPLFLVSLADTAVALLVVNKHFKSQAHIVTGLVSFSFALFAFSIGIMSLGVPGAVMLWSFKVAALAGSPIPILILLLSEAFSSQQVSAKRLKLFALLFPGVFFLTFSLTNIWLQAQSFNSHSIVINVNPFFAAAYLLYYVIYFTLALKTFFRTYLNSVGIRRYQLGYLLLGFIPTIVVGAFCNVFMVFIGVGRLIYFGPLSSIFLVGFTAYAITRHHLLDIEIVIKKTAFYSILTALLTAIFVALIVVSQQLLSGLIGYTSFFAALIGSFIIALIFQPLRDKIQALVDKLFFKSKYDYSQELSKISSQITSNLSLDNILHTRRGCES